MNQYQYEKWQRMLDDAYAYLSSDCPLTEDEVMIAVYKDYIAMYNFIQYIANDYFELSHEKVRIQRDDYIRRARDLMKQINEYEE